jgi:hypothetical protein
MSSIVWYVIRDSDTYRSLQNTDPDGSHDLLELFRSGDALGDAWDPPVFRLYDEAGEEAKPVGHFLGCAGLFVVNRFALDILFPIIEPTLIEILPLPSPLGDLSVLNLKKVDCIDHSTAQFKYFKSGRIMRVDKYAFDEDRLHGRHLFRLPAESFTKVFADAIFKTTVEMNGLSGLSFLPLDQI